MNPLVDYWDIDNSESREPLTEYDDQGCMILLAAIVRRWWLDGREDGVDELRELADFLEVDVRLLQDGRPAKFCAERRSVFWLEEPI